MLSLSSLVDPFVDPFAVMIHGHGPSYAGIDDSMVGELRMHKQSVNQ